MNVAGAVATGASVDFADLVEGHVDREIGGTDRVVLRVEHAEQDPGRADGILDVEEERDAGRPGGAPDGLADGRADAGRCRRPRVGPQPATTSASARARMPPRAAGGAGARGRSHGDKRSRDGSTGPSPAAGDRAASPGAG